MLFRFFSPQRFSISWISCKIQQTVSEKKFCSSQIYFTRVSFTDIFFMAYICRYLQLSLLNCCTLCRRMAKIIFPPSFASSLAVWNESRASQSFSRDCEHFTFPAHRLVKVFLPSTGYNDEDTTTSWKRRGEKVNVWLRHIIQFTCRQAIFCLRNIVSFSFSGVKVKRVLCKFNMLKHRIFSFSEKNFSLLLITLFFNIQIIQSPSSCAVLIFSYFHHVFTFYHMNDNHSQMRESENISRHSQRGNFHFSTIAMRFRHHIA